MSGAGSAAVPGSNAPGAGPAHGTCIEEIRHYLSETFQLPAADIPDDVALLRGRLDSIGLLVLIAHLEEIYGIAIAEDEVGPANFRTLLDVARLVARKRGDLPAPSSTRQPAPPDAEVEPEP